MDTEKLQKCFSYTQRNKGLVSLHNQWRERNLKHKHVSKYCSEKDKEPNLGGGLTNLDNRRPNYPGGKGSGVVTEVN